MNEFTGFFIVVALLILSIGLFFFIRQLVLWYFRIERQIELLEEILYALKPELRPKPSSISNPHLTFPRFRRILDQANKSLIGGR
jgi:hypothetical protein